MKVDKVTYKNFRNIEYAEVEPCPTVTAFTGKNGQGKTNGLEGIYLFARGRSFRTPRERELISFGCETGGITLSFTDERRRQEMSVVWNSKGKRICKKNGVTLKKMSELIGVFRAVLFCPQQLAIVNEGPSERRAFLDVAISQLDHTYLSALQRYYKILSQRNAHIKQIRERYDRHLTDADTTTAEVLSEQLCAEAETITSKRSEYVCELDAHIKNFFNDMTTGREKPDIRYQSETSPEELYTKLCSDFEREIRYGATLHGIHKDDIEIILDGHEARSFASQGQQRSIALSMKLGEGEISRSRTGEYSVFLFDDIMSELDIERRDYIVKEMEDRQVIITSCNPLENAQREYTVEKGVYILNH